MPETGQNVVVVPAFRRLRTSPVQIEILKSVGVSQARGAVVTIGQPEMADRIVAALHEFFPDLPIFVRARDLLHGRRLETEGAGAPDCGRWFGGSMKRCQVSMRCT